MLVYVLSKSGKPLMPTTPARARKKLKAGLAKVIRREPFTIKLLYDSKEYVQELIHGVDTGSSTVGSAVADAEGRVVYISEITIRNDVTKNMKQRASYRRNRRNRKTRYRPARWLNRKNSKRSDRLSPTMISKLGSHLKEIRFVRSILPIAETILETAAFDTHALKDPSVRNSKWKYQKGVNYGFANTKAYVLNRDKHTCQNCKGKSMDRRLEVHHLVFRRHNGSDEPENLITLCKQCHDGLHAETIELKVSGKKKSLLNHATQMNSIGIQLLRILQCEETFGYLTKEHRQLQGLPKTHYVDAAIAAAKGGTVRFRTNSLLRKVCIADGDYQQTKGRHSEQRIITGKIHGFRKYDKVGYLGKQYFIKGRMSTGYAILMDINEVKADLKPIPKFSKMRRVGARKSWIIQAETILNIS